MMAKGWLASVECGIEVEMGFALATARRLDGSLIEL